MNELINLIDKLYESLGVTGVIVLMWVIAFVFEPIFQIVVYHIDCKKYGKKVANRIHRRM